MERFEGLRGFDAAARVGVVIAAVACVVGCVLAMEDTGAGRWWSVALVVVAALVVVLAPRGPGPSIVAAVAGVIAMVLLGDRLFEPKPVPAALDALTGVGVPSIAWYFAWLSAGVLIVIAVAGAVLAWRVERRRSMPALVAGVVATAVLLGAAIPAGSALAEGTKDRLSERGIDHTIAADAGPVPAPDRGAPDFSHKRWWGPVIAGTQGDGRSVVVPGRGLVVLVQKSESTDPKQPGYTELLRVMDARTGAERWHFGPSVGTVLVDAADGRVLLVDNPAVISFDLATGRMLGAARLPTRSADGSFANYDFAAANVWTNLPVIGRTALLEQLTETGDESVAEVLAIDAVTLRMTVVERKPGCDYAVAPGSTNPVRLVRFSCPANALLTVTDGRITNEKPLPVKNTDRLTGAEATDRGAVLTFLPEPDPAPQVVLAYAENKPDPVLRLQDDDHHDYTPFTIPASGSDPARIVVLDRTTTRVRYEDKITGTFEVYDTAGAKLSSVPAAADFDAVNPGMPAAVTYAATGDRLFVLGGNPAGVQVLDAHTLRGLGATAIPCDVYSVSAAGATGVVQCGDLNGRAIVYD